MPVPACRTINDAFAFYYAQPGVFLPSVQAVSEYLKENSSVLVLQRARQLNQRDRLSQLPFLGMNDFWQTILIIYKSNK